MELLPAPCTKICELSRTCLPGFHTEQLKMRTKIQEIQGPGMTYIVLMASAYVCADKAEYYSPGGVYPFASITGIT